MNKPTSNNQRLTTLSREIMHHIAGNPASEATLQYLIDCAIEVTGGQAGFLAMVGDPQYSAQVNLTGAISDLIDDRFLNHVDTLVDDVHIQADLLLNVSESFPFALVRPFHRGDSLMAVLVVLYSDQPDLPESTLESLDVLIDAILIVTRELSMKLHHQQKMRNQYEFVRIVSHDLRSPLTSIQGFASMLESTSVGDLNEQQARFVSKVLSGASQMAALIDNIQDAGRYDPATGFYEMDRTPTDLLSTVTRIVDSYLMPAEKQNLTLVTVTDERVPIVNVDQTMIDRAVTNLVDNAIKYTPDGGRIEVGVEKVENEIIIRVTDNGYGINADHLHKLFQRHFRIRRLEHKKVKGSGLGLFIVKSVAIHHGGDAWVESVEGEGSSFAIRIPLAGENLLSASQVE